MAQNNLGSIPSVEEMMERIQKRAEAWEEDPEHLRELMEGKPSGNPIQLGPRMASPEDQTKYQIEGAKNASKKWLDRVTHPRKNFKEEALKPRAAERYKESMEEVLDKGLWQGGMENVDVDATIKTIEAGGDKVYSEGVARREAKILSRNKELYPARLALLEELDAMDTATDTAREEKMIANLRGLKAIGKARRGA